MYHDVEDIYNELEKNENSKNRIKARCCYNCKFSKSDYAWSHCNFLMKDNKDDEICSDEVYWSEVCDNFEFRED